MIRVIVNDSDSNGDSNVDTDSNSNTIQSELHLGPSETT